MAREHLAELAEAKIPLVGEGKVTELETWTKPILGFIVLIFSFLAGLFVVNWVRGKAGTMTGQAPLSLDQSIHAAVYGAAPPGS